MSDKGVKFIFLHIDELPEKVEEGIVYVCDADKRALLLCPCGCKDEIHLNLLSDSRPCWTIKDNNIKPSINKKVGCMSHFTITNGITH